MDFDLKAHVDHRAVCHLLGSKTEAAQRRRELS